MNTHQVFLSAVNTEKSVTGQEKNQQIFYVHANATKIDIKKAFKEIWGVEVKTVNIIQTRKKMRVAGKKGPQIKRLPKKKAVISIKDSASFEMLKFAGDKKITSVKVKAEDNKTKVVKKDNEEKTNS